MDIFQPSLWDHSNAITHHTIEDLKTSPGLGTYVASKSTRYSKHEIDTNGKITQLKNNLHRNISRKNDKTWIRGSGQSRNRIQTYGSNWWSWRKDVMNTYNQIVKKQQIGLQYHLYVNKVEEWLQAACMERSSCQADHSWKDKKTAPEPGRHSCHLPWLRDARHCSRC